MIYCGSVAKDHLSVISGPKKRREGRMKGERKLRIGTIGREPDDTLNERDSRVADLEGWMGERIGKSKGNG